MCYNNLQGGFQLILLWHLFRNKRRVGWEKRYAVKIAVKAVVCL